MEPRLHCDPVQRWLDGWMDAYRLNVAFGVDMVSLMIRVWNESVQQSARSGLILFCVKCDNVSTYKIAGYSLYPTREKAIIISGEPLRKLQSIYLKVHHRAMCPLYQCDTMLF